MSTAPENDRDKLIYDIVLERHKQEWDRTKDLDSKANNMIGFAGIIAALSVAVWELLPKGHFEHLFSIPLTTFIIAAFLGLLAYWITDFETINPEAIIKGYSDSSEEEVLRAFVATTSKITMSNNSRNQRKANLIYAALLVLVVSMGLFAAFSIVNIII